MGGLAKQLIKGSFFRTSALFLNVVVSFFLMPFVIRSLGDRWYGLWVLVATFVGYFGFFDLGLSTAVQRFVSQALGRKDQREIDRIFNTCLVLFSGVSLLTFATAVAVALASPHFIRNPADIHVFQTTIVLIGINVALSFLARAFEGYLTSYIRYDVVNTIEISKLLVRSVLILYFLGRGHGIVALAIITLCVEAASYIATVLTVLKFFPALTVHLSHFTRAHISPLLSYSIYSFIANLADQLRFHFNAFVISGFLGLTLVTHYNIGARISDYYMAIIASATALIFPVYSMLEGLNDFEQIRKRYLFVMKLAAILSIFIGGSIFIYGRAFISRWMGSAYLDSFYVLAILTGGICVNNIVKTSKPVLYSLSKNKGYAIIVTAEGIVNLVLSVILVKVWGIYGVAVGTVVPMFITNLFVIPAYTNRAIGLDSGTYWRTLGKVVGLGALSQLACWLLVRSFIESSFGRLFLLGALTTVIFFAVNIMLLLTKTERRYFGIPF